MSPAKGIGIDCMDIGAEGGARVRPKAHVPGIHMAVNALEGGLVAPGAGGQVIDGMLGKGQP